MGITDIPFKAPQLTRQELYAIHGGVWQSTNRATIGTTVINTTYNGGSLVVPYGFRARCSGVTIKSTFGGRLIGYICRGWFAQTQPQLINTLESTFPAGGGELYFSYSQAVEFLEGGLFQPKITATEATSNNFITVEVHDPELISMGMNTDAPFYHLSMGDSIQWQILGNIGGGALPNLGKTLYTSRAMADLRAHGVKIWHLKKAFGGASTQDWLNAIYSGYFDMPYSEAEKVVSATLGIGINDAANAANTVATQDGDYTTKLKLGITELYKKFPNLENLFLAGQTPVDPTDTNRNLYVAGYRSALQALVADQTFAATIPNMKLSYIDMVTGFTVAAASYTDTNPYLHPRGDTGHVYMYNSFLPVLQASTLWTDTKYR